MYEEEIHEEKIKSVKRIVCSRNIPSARHLPSISSCTVGFNLPSSQYDSDFGELAYKRIENLDHISIHLPIHSTYYPDETSYHFKYQDKAECIMKGTSRDTLLECKPTNGGD